MARKARQSLADRLSSRRGQTALVLILVIAIALVIYAASLNWSRVTQYKTLTITGSNLAASSMASIISSYGEQQLQVNLGGRPKYCKRTNFFVMVALIVIVVVVVIVTWAMAVAALGPVIAAIIAVAAITLAVAALAINLMVIQPGLVALWNRMQDSLLTMEDKVVENGIMTGLQSAVTDPIRVQDHFDMDLDGQWVDSLGRNNVIGAPDKISRFAYFYTMRLKQLEPIKLEEVDGFMHELRELIEDNPYKKAGSGCTPLQQASGSIVCEEPDNFGLFDSGCLGQNPPSPYCNPCCVPLKDSQGVERPSACAPTVPVDPVCMVGGGYPANASQGTPYYPFQYDPFYENYDNTFLSFREKLGMDDEHPLYTKDPQNPNGLQGIDTTAPPTGAFRQDDATGFYKDLPDKRKGIFPFFWDMANLKSAPVTEVTITPQTPPTGPGGVPGGEVPGGGVPSGNGGPLGLPSDPGVPEVFPAPDPADPIPAPITTDPAVVINAGAVEGPVTHRASGFLFPGVGAWFSEYPLPPSVMALAAPLKPRFIREGGNDILGSGYAVNQAFGAVSELLLPDNFGYPDINKLNSPGEGGDWTKWDNYVRDMAQRVKASGKVVRWDIWNEPDLTMFWYRPESDYLEMWRRSVTIIREIDPAAVIVGPSLGHYNPLKIYQYMKFFKDNNVLPDIVSWHELDGAWGEVPDIPAHVQEVKSQLTGLGLSINRFEINESIQQSMQYSPGVYVGTVAKMEEAKIEHAGRACWNDPETGSQNCYNATLNGLLTYPDRQPRPIYWAYKAYADITGQLVAIAPNNGISGVAGYNSNTQTVKVLLGTNVPQVTNPKVRLTNLDKAGFPSGSVVQLVAQRIPGTPAALGSLPITINKSFMVTNGAVEVTLPNFDALGAYVLTVMRPDNVAPASQSNTDNPSAPATGASVTAKKAAVGAAATAVPLAAAVTSSNSVAIDFGADQGPATYRGSGFLWPWRSKENAGQLFSAVQALKPKLIRQVFSLAVDTLSYTNALGAQVTVLIPDGFGYQPWHPAPGDNGDWAPWETYVRNIVQQANSIGFKPRWDIWNEPDYVQFWQRPEEQYLEAFVRAVRVIRSVDPQATIVGPSLSKYSPSTMGRFLTYFRDHNAVPNVISWHPLDSGNDAPAIRAELADVKGWVSFLGINVNRFEVNETMQESHFTSAGMHAWTMAEIEAAKEIEVAARTCWPVNNTDSCLNSTIGGLLTQGDRQYRAIYWSYKAYADITGRMVSVAPYSDVWGVAGFDSSKGMAKILLGRKSYSTGDVPVLLANLDRAGFQNNTQIHVVAENIPDTSAPALPTVTLNEDYQVVDGTVNLTLPNFGGYSAYILTITSTDAGAYVPPPPPEPPPPTGDPTSPGSPPTGGNDPGGGGLPGGGQPPAQPPAPVTVQVKTDNVIMPTADPATCLVPSGETPTMTNCPNRFVAAPEMCSLDEWDKDRNATKGFWWKPGIDHYCSQEYPYYDCVARTGSCQAGPFNGSVPTCGCMASPDHTVWHEDVIDSLVDGLTRFVGWGEKLLKMSKDNPASLYQSFPDWYNGAAYWIAPACKPEWNCNSDVNAKQPECSACNQQDFNGYMMIWRDQLGGWVDLLDNWLYRTSFAKNDVLCLPPQGTTGPAPLPLPASQLPSQQVGAAQPKDRDGKDIPPVWGNLDDTIACLEAVAGADVQERVTYLKKLREEAKAVRQIFFEGYDRFNRFLEPCRADGELGNPADCINGHCLLDTDGEPRGGPAANLICARQNFVQHTAKLSNFAIYGWMTPPVAGRANKNDHGYWHIVRVESFAPKRCYHYCWVDEFPKVKTYIKWKFNPFYGADQFQCYELTKTNGLVVTRVTRYDEDHDSPFARFANGQKIWNFRFGNPGVTPSVLASPANLERTCAPQKAYFDGTSTETEDHIRSAFMINDNPTKDPSNSAACWEQVNALLDTGVQTTTCARYFLDNSIKHMSLKFTPCPPAVTNKVFDCAKKDGTPDACP